MEIDNEISAFYPHVYGWLSKKWQNLDSAKGFFLLLLIKNE